MFDLIASVLAWFYSAVPSYGFAIAMLTLTVMVLVTPLTLKGTRSMLQMQRLQPELKRIQNRYRDDRQKMNEEMMAFYQENGINPLGGCLPLFVQMPVFLVLFRVVRGLTRRETAIGLQSGWTAARHAVGGTFDLATVSGNERLFEPEYLDHSSGLYQRLSESNEMVSAGIDLSRSASSVLSDSFVSALPYIVLIVAVLVTSLVQQRQIQGRNSGAQVNPQQQAIMRVMPFFLPVFAYTMPAALVVYFVVSNLYRIGQQAYITRSLYSGDDAPGVLLAKERAAGGSGGGDKKGRATPKRDARGSGRGGSKGDKGREAGSARAKGRGSGSNRVSRASKSGSGSKGSGGRPVKGKGAGRTGKAPTRHGSGGRTTKPGSPQHRKKKRK